MGDQGLIVGGLGFRHRQFRLDPRRPDRFVNALVTLGNQRRFQCLDILREVFKGGGHAMIES